LRLDLSNPRELGGELLGVLDQVVRVLVELSQRLCHLIELVAFHRRSVASESGYFCLDLDKTRVQGHALVSAAAPLRR
jgi:hypothetical protein